MAACPPGLKPARTAQIVFGRDIGERLGVSDDDWQSFLDREVATRFPNGFTVVDANGQWRGGEGQTVREPSKVLLIVLTGAPHETERLAGLARAYKRQFRQDSVLLVEQSACATF
jgi:NAD(P)H-hydrate repair Nnr-like enzyme with NAD(P)H-hydrate dehydratase domain